MLSQLALQARRTSPRTNWPIYVDGELFAVVPYQKRSDIDSDLLRAVRSGLRQAKTHRSEQVEVDSLADLVRVAERLKISIENDSVS